MDDSNVLRGYGYLLQIWPSKTITSLEKLKDADYPYIIIMQGPEYKHAEAVEGPQIYELVKSTYLDKGWTFLHASCMIAYSAPQTEDWQEDMENLRRENKGKPTL
jgi:hypothetical protein